MLGIFDGSFPIWFGRYFQCHLPFLWKMDQKRSYFLSDNSENSIHSNTVIATTRDYNYTALLFRTLCDFHSNFSLELYRVRFTGIFFLPHKSISLSQLSSNKSCMICSFLTWKWTKDLFFTEKQHKTPKNSNIFSMYRTRAISNRSWIIDAPEYSS